MINTDSLNAIGYIGLIMVIIGVIVTTYFGLKVIKLIIKREKLYDRVSSPNWLYRIDNLSKRINDSTGYLIGSLVILFIGDILLLTQFFA